MTLVPVFPSHFSLILHFSLTLMQLIHALRKSKESDGQPYRHLERCYRNI